MADWLTPDPFLYPEVWDYVVVAGVASPGVCKVSKAKRVYEWDKKKGKGALGETSTFVQKPAVAFTLTFQFWTSAQIAAWDSFMLLLEYDPTKEAVQAVEILAAALARLGVAAVVTDSIGEMEHLGKGLFQVEVDVHEYAAVPKSSAVSTPDSATGGGAGGQGGKGSGAGSAGDALDREVAAAAKDAKQAGEAAMS